MNIHEYIERKNIRTNTPALLTGGKWYRLVEGKWIPEAEFKKKFPLPLRVGEHGKNPDSRKNYLL